jgi:hypothetical protein
MISISCDFLSIHKNINNRDNKIVMSSKNSSTFRALEFCCRYGFENREK